ncbi:MAG: hypothetical protein ABSF47_02400 [Minisyncoccia bacterium]|jgi:hypothetical protein
MNSETKTCQNCKQNFVIEPEDFEFYKRFKMPAPMFCPDCRRQRRMFFRNERNLYKRKCNAPGHGEEILSVFSPDKPVTVYDDRYWWSDGWDPLDYGKSYDFSKPFFEQYKELLRRVPLINLSIANMSNCSYCNVSEGDKDSFFITASERNENVAYSNRVVSCKDSQDVYIANADELCYETVSAQKCYRLFFGRNCAECVNSAFLFNCMNCDHCFCSTNLRNKSYYFFNQPHTKEEYEKKVSAYNLGSAKTVQALRNELKKLEEQSVHRFANLVKCVDVTGDNIMYAKNTKQSFDVVGNPSAEDSKFISWAGAVIKDVYDGGPGVGITLEQSYDVTDTGIQVARAFFTSVVYGSYDIYYSINCHASRNLWGCYGLRSKEYCILNKQYTKEEYQALLPKIIEHMNSMPYVDKIGRVFRYGEFFPAEVSPFAYNEVISHEYFPLTKEEALKQGYLWKDWDTKDYKVTLKPEDLPDDIRDTGDSIMNETIGCAHAGNCMDQCTTAFKIMPRELEFYRRLNLPLPRLCYNCRHGERLRQRNPMQLWCRKCQCAGGASENGVYKNTVAHTHHGTGHCPNEFETSYAPERKEIVYCEQCYQAEVI